MRLGDTFLMPVPDQSYDHLWIVISDPDKHAGAYIVVNLTKDVARSGKECALKPNDHPWVKEECFVNFADALEITQEKAAKVDALVNKVITMHAKLETKILERIVTAAKSSKSLSLAYKKYL